MPEPIIETHDLCKRFGKRLVVDQLSLVVEEGEIFGFLGPNGAGKSTTIRMLLSLIKPTTGGASVFGQSIQSEYPGYLGRIGALVESADFYQNLSALRNLQMLARLHPDVDVDRCWEVLKMVGLEDRAHSKVKTYSHGMKQRLGIAQAILHRPKLLILDEPSTGLDPQGMHEVRHMIKGFARDQGMTIFLSSHLLNEVEQICTSMAVLREGKLLVSGKVADFLSAEAAPLTELYATPLDGARQILGGLEFVTGIHDTEAGGLRFKVDHAQRPAVLRALVEKDIAVYSMTPVSKLEDYFLSLFDHGELS